MKKNLCLFFLLCFFLPGRSQVTIDKDQFRKVYINIMNERKDLFKGIPRSSRDTVNNKAFRMPGADICQVSGAGYHAIYRLMDSLPADLLFRQMQNLLDYAVQPFGARAYFSVLNDNPHYLFFYPADTAGFINSDGNVLIFNYEQRDKKAEVILGISSESRYGHFTRVGNRINDPELTRLIQDAGFGKDTDMVTIRGVKVKTDSRGSTYTCNRRIPGYKSSVYIQKGNGEDAGRSLLTLEKTIKNDGELLNKTMNELLSRLKAALPEHYYYLVNEEEQSISFYVLPYATRQDNTICRITYGTDPKNKQVLTLGIELERWRESGDNPDKDPDSVETGNDN